LYCKFEVHRPVHVAVAMLTVCLSVGGSRLSHMQPNRPCIGIEIITAYFFSLPEEPTRAHMVCEMRLTTPGCWEHRKSGKQGEAKTVREAAKGQMSSPLSGKEANAGNAGGA